MGWSRYDVGEQQGNVTEPAQVALAAVREGIDAARSRLLTAGELDWVSSAAEQYREQVEEAVRDVLRLGHVLTVAHAAVLRHTRASDDGYAAVLAQPGGQLAVLGLTDQSWFPPPSASPSSSTAFARSGDE